jgi:hypothetical protein
MLSFSSSPGRESSLRKILLEDFFRNPETTAYDPSPSGEPIAFLKPVENRLNVFMRKKSGVDTTQVIHVTYIDIQSFEKEKNTLRI